MANSVSDTVEYREIPWLEGYRAGSDGSVWSRWKQSSHGRGTGTFRYLGEVWKRLKVYTNKSRRAVASFGRGRLISIGRLILEVFVGPCPAEMECCHFPDRDPSNCRLDNLRWGTSAENTDDQRQHSTLIGGERHGMAKLTNEQIDEIKSLAGKMTHLDIANLFGVSQSHVTDIINERRRTAESHAGRGLHGAPPRTGKKSPGLVAKGERNGNSRLSAENVVEIKKLIKEGEKQWQIADRFGVTKATISAISRGLTWRHVCE